MDDISFPTYGDAAAAAAAAASVAANQIRLPFSFFSSESKFIPLQTSSETTEAELLLKVASDMKLYS